MMVARPMFPRWKSCARALGAGVVLAAAVACGGRSESGTGGPPGGGGGMPPMAVEAITLAASPIERTTDFVGSVKSRLSMTVQPQAEGILTRIAVRSGDRVSPGAVLFEIDSAPQQAAVANLESEKLARQASAAYARQQADRVKKLFDAGAESQAQVDQARAALEVAEAQVKAVDELIRQQRAQLAYYRVTASTSGVVGDVPVRLGDRVTRATVLTTIDDNSGLEVYINVPVQDASRLRVGLPVRITDDRGAVIASERLTFVAGSVDESTQTVLAKAAVSDRSGRFRSDQFVRGQVVWSTEPGLTIPLTSVLRVNSQYFVYVVQAGPAGGPPLVAKQRAVSLGPVLGNNYIVVSGLEAGERVVVGGIQKIGDGAPVSVSAPAAPAPASGRGGR